MASIRRTLSPASHDRSHQNGSSFLSLPSHKSIINGKYSSSSFSSYAFFNLRRGCGGGAKGFRRSLYRCFVFFLVGLLLGILPFGHDDQNNHNTDIHDLSFEMKPPRVNLMAKPDDYSLNSISLGSQNSDKLNGVFSRFDFKERKELIIVTPTYNRALQGYYLSRLGQVLRLVHPPLLWIVVEMNGASMETADSLRKTGVMYRHLVCARNNSENVKDRGVHQRNVALEHIERHRLDGIVYFADDDNVYSLELFESLRGISRFGTWPVAMLAQSKNKAILEGPVCNGSQVIGWHTNEKSKKLRRFHVDMSGFAFNSTILWDPKRWKLPSSVPVRLLDTVKEGFQETSFIEQLVEDESQMEGVRPGCLRILNWHLHLDAGGFVYPKGWVLEKNLDPILPIKLRRLSFAI